MYIYTNSYLKFSTKPSIPLTLYFIYHNSPMHFYTDLYTKTLSTPMSTPIPCLHQFLHQYLAYTNVYTNTLPTPISTPLRPLKSPYYTTYTLLHLTTPPTPYHIAYTAYTTSTNVSTPAISGQHLILLVQVENLNES